MHKLLEKVEKELNTIAEKGISSSNLETAYKLIDIYKDIKESEYYEKEVKDGGEYNARQRDSRGRYMGDDYSMRYDERDYMRGNSGGYWESRGRYSTHSGLDEKTERYFNRMREGMESYSAGRDRYRNGDNQDRMVDGIEMTMAAVCMFVESLYDFAETPQEKEIIRKHIDKMKKM